jgi:hypothetical protein
VLFFTILAASQEAANLPTLMKARPKCRAAASFNKVAEGKPGQAGFVSTAFAKK